MSSLSPFSLSVPIANVHVSFPEMQMHQHNLPAGVMPVEKSGSASDLESSPDSAEKKGHFGSKFIKGRMGRH